MAISYTNIRNNPQTPGSAGVQYLPDQLVAGDKKIVTQPVVVTSGTYARGTVMGQVTAISATSTPGTNTGNGTVGSIAPADGIESGNYTLTATGATTFTVKDPAGASLANATVGTPYTSAEIAFTITAGGTAFVAGDSFVIAVQDSVGNFIPSVRTASDGSQNPTGILVDAVDASAGPVRAGIYVEGEFNANAITHDASWNIGQLVQAMRQYGLIIKEIVPGLTAADPT